MITKEWLMKTYGITDEDLTGIDIELILRYDTNCTVEMMSDFASKDSVINSLQNSQRFSLEKHEVEQWRAENGLEYLMEGSPCDGEMPPVETLRWLAVESPYIKFPVGGDFSPLVGYVCAIVDVKNSIIYYETHGNQLTKEYRLGTPYTLTDDEKATLFLAFTEEDFTQLTSKNAGGSGWHLGMEFDNGEVYTYEIGTKGSENNGFNYYGLEIYISEADVTGRPCKLAEEIFSHEYKWVQRFGK